MERITSRRNAVVTRFRDLVRAAAARTDDVLLDGEHLLDEALACGVPIDTAVFADRLLADAGSPASRLARDARKHGARVFAAGDTVMEAMSPVRQPSGVVAIAKVRQASIHDAMTANGAPPLVPILAGVQDPGNVGAILRTAAAFGATGAIALEGSANPFGWKALRGGMGATFRLPVAAHASSADVVGAARAASLLIVAAVPRGGTPLPDVDWRRPLAVVLGGEGAGVPASIMPAVEDTITIPMHRPIESLNVAIAGALLLYEAARQRGTR